METLRVVEITPDANSPQMREAAGVMLQYLEYVGKDYVHDDAEVDMYIQQSCHKGEVHHALLDAQGSVVAVIAQGPEEERGTVDIKRMAVVGNLQRRRGERYGTRAMLGVAKIAIRDGKRRLNLFSREESAPFYEDWLGFTVVKAARRQMETDVQSLCSRFPDLASDASILID